MRIIFLMENEVGEVVLSLAPVKELEAVLTIVNSLQALEAACIDTYDLLLSFGTGVIVPKHILQTPGLISINVHAASPEFPGRDPHHFAIYYGATEYGATLHYMEEYVDQGKILDVELFSVPDSASPKDLLEMANTAGFELIKRLFIFLKASGIQAISKMPAPNSWGSRKFTRKDFLELCRIDSSITMEEFNRRLRATAMPGYCNLYIEIFGHRFNIDTSFE